MMKRLTGGAGLALLLAGCAATRTPESAYQKSEDNKALVIAFHAAVGRQDFAAAERMLAPGYRHHVVSAEGFRPLTWAAFQRGNAAAHAAFPDWVNEPTRVVADGNYVSLILLGSGTHRGSLAGEAATGRKVVLPIAVTHELQDGKIVADWEVVDTGPVMRALQAPSP